MGSSGGRGGGGGAGEEIDENAGGLMRGGGVREMGGEGRWKREGREEKNEEGGVDKRCVGGGTGGSGGCDLMDGGRGKKEVDGSEVR